LPFGEIVGKHPPLAPGLYEIQDGVYEFSLFMLLKMFPAVFSVEKKG
jgi:hypothetical protein